MNTKASDLRIPVTATAEELLAEVAELERTVRVLRTRIAELESAGGTKADAEERLRRSEQEVRETRERLAHVTRLSTLGEMATGIAHEINQPLAAVATYAQACSRMIRSRSTDDVELLETLDRIGGEALRAGAIINKLKDLVRRRDSRHIPCDINALVRDVAGLAGLDAQHHGIDLCLELEPGLPLVVADQIQVQQVILNLVRNGMEAMEGDRIGVGALVLQTRVGAEDTVEVAVSDCGIGLDEQDTEAIFAPFYTTKESGMGMGLSISRTIIRAHGGKIGYSGNPDGGTTFWFALPIDGGEPDDA